MIQQSHDSSMQSGGMIVKYKVTAGKELIQKRNGSKCEEEMV